MNKKPNFQFSIFNFQLPGLKAVFFDMDGVLFDSMPLHAKSWAQAMNAVGIPFSEYKTYLNEGRTGNSTINEEFIRVFGREATEEEKKKIYTLKTTLFDSYGKAPAIPYSLELLQKVKAQGLKIVLVTGSGQPSLLDNLEQSFPGFFTKENMVTAFDVKYGKPHPEPYLMALKKAGVSANEAIVVENAPLGIESATKAGIFTIAINTGILENEVLEKAGADIVLKGGMEELYKRWGI